MSACGRGHGLPTGIGLAESQTEAEVLRENQDAAALQGTTTITGQSRFSTSLRLTEPARR
jgi:hypothetical protein